MKVIIAGSVPEAIQILTSEENCRILAGGTDLLVSMNGYAVPDDLTIVSIGDIEELKNISEGDTSIDIGSLVTDTRLIGSETIRKEAFALWKAAHESASPQIRNRATVGGNIGTASPAADVVCALEALGAAAAVEGPDGTRKVKVEDLITGVKRTALGKGEIITGVSVEKGWSSSFFKQGKRKAVTISVINVAAAVKMNGEILEDIRIVIGSAAQTHVRAFELERSLTGIKYDLEEIERIVTEADYPVSPITDTRAPGWYRNKLIPVLTKRAVIDACERGIGQ